MFFRLSDMLVKTWKGISDSRRMAKNTSMSSRQTVGWDTWLLLNFMTYLFICEMEKSYAMHCVRKKVAYFMRKVSLL